MSEQSRLDALRTPELHAGAGDESCPDGPESVLKAQSRIFRDRSPDALIKSQVTGVEAKGVCCKVLCKGLETEERHVRPCVQKGLSGSTEGDRLEGVSPAAETRGMERNPWVGMEGARRAGSQVREKTHFWLKCWRSDWG